jgi:hypothetical protein
MKKESKMLIATVLVFSLALLVKLSPSDMLHGQAGLPGSGLQWVATVCNDGMSQYLCNNCKSDEDVCFDHTCAQCR